MTASNTPRINIEPAGKSLDDGTLSRRPGAPPTIQGAATKPAGSTKSQARKRLKTIRSAQKQLAQTIRQLQEKLRQVKQMPSSQPFITQKRVNSIKGLGGTRKSLKEALEDDLRTLRKEMRNLKKRERWVIRGPAVRARKDFRKRLEEALRRAEASGGLDDAELEALQKESAKVLDKFVDILDANPSVENMESVVVEMETTLWVGADSDRAQQSLGVAATKLQNTAEGDFRRRPTTDNFVKYLNSMELTQAVGGIDKAVRQGWKSVDTTHPVAQGDTLASISKRYYGDPGYWDIIYLENLGEIGDFRSLIIGTILRIP